MIGGIVGGALGAVGGLFGGLSQRNKLRAMERMVEEQKRDNQNWYDRRYNEDATQRADAQRILSMTEEAIRNRNRQAAGTAAVMGGTQESVAADKAANAQALADATSQIAIAGDQRKDTIENTYLSRENALNEELRKLKGATPGVMDIASGAIGGAASGIGRGIDIESAFKKG